MIMIEFDNAGVLKQGAFINFLLQFKRIQNP